MTPRDTIIDELGAPAQELAEETRYAICKQAGSIGTTLDTGYGYLRLTMDESAQVQALLHRLLEKRLVMLEGGDL